MMKRALRIFLLTLTVIALCLSLCSCTYLDELKEMRTLWDENGINLVCNGEVYKPLPSYVTINTDNLDYEGMIYLVKEDVPLLLMSDYCDRNGARYTYDIFRVVLLWESDEGVYFCHEDDFDAMIKTNPV